jgi:hypothetical protein
MNYMEQSETPREPAADPAGQGPLPASDQPQEPAPKPQLPDPKGGFPIPDHFRLPLHGKMVTPTAVPSAMERAHRMAQEQKKRRRRGFLLGLLVGQLLIIGLDLGGEFFLRTHPHFKLQAPIRVPSIVFLGMAAGAAVMILAVALIYAGMGLRSLFARKPGGVVAAAGGGVKRIFLTALALGVSMAVILGTAWFMIPASEWKPTVDFAKDQGKRGVEASKSQLRSMFSRGARTP